MNLSFKLTNGITLVEIDQLHIVRMHGHDSLCMCIFLHISHIYYQNSYMEITQTSTQWILATAHCCQYTKVQTCVGDKNVQMLTTVYLLPSTTEHKQIFRAVREKVNCYLRCITEAISWRLYSGHLFTQINYILYESLDMKVWQSTLQIGWLNR